jgi:surface carbohydrate biosynthesis protein
MRIALIVDNPKRDLKGLGILGYDLAKAGHEVYLTPMNLQQFEIPKLMPDVMLTSGYRKTTYPFYKKFKDMGVGIAVLETEGGFSYNEELLQMRIEDHPGSDDLVDLFFCWGEKYREIVKKYTNINPKKIFVTGNPRFEIKKSWPEKRDKILFSPNFSIIQGNGLDTILINRYLKDINVDVRPNFEGVQEYFQYFLHVAKLVDQKYPGQVIYRPHPFDDLALLKSKLEGTSIAIDENFSISETLVACAVCIQNSSTTGFEALLYEVPTIIPREVKSNFRSKEIDEMSYNLYSDKEILDYIERALNQELTIPQQFFDVVNRVCKIDVNASERITKILSEHHFAHSNQTPQKISDLLPLNKRIRRFVKDLLQGKLKFKHLTYSYYNQYYDSFKAFDAEGVMEIVKSYRQKDVNISSCISELHIESIKMIRSH